MRNDQKCERYNTWDDLNLCIRQWARIHSLVIPQVSKAHVIQRYNISGDINQCFSHNEQVGIHSLGIPLVSKARMIWNTCSGIFLILFKAYVIFSKTEKDHINLSSDTPPYLTCVLIFIHIYNLNQELDQTTKQV